MLDLPLYVLVMLGVVPVLSSLLFTYLHLILMKKKNWGQYIRQYGPKIHEYKTGTPTAGGIPILLSTVGGFFLVRYFVPAAGDFLPVLTTGTLSFGLIGLADDLISLSRERSKGLGGRHKLLLQLGASALVFFQLRNVPSATKLELPFSLSAIGLNGIALWAFTTVLLLAVVNSLNLTDGLDGLAAGTTVITLVGFSFLAPNGLLPFVMVAISVCLGFLWYNFYPADLFMGDTGSFALGGLVGTSFLITGTGLYLPLLGTVFVLETASVIIQVSLYKRTGTRLFKVSPLHHHFEEAEEVNYEFLLPEVEWKEPKITVRFFILQAIFAIFGLLVFFQT